jgi:hypothetical protein
MWHPGRARRLNFAAGWRRIRSRGGFEMQPDFQHPARIRSRRPSRRCCRKFDVRFGPISGLKSDISRGPRSAICYLMHRSTQHRLFDHLVGECEQFRRKIEAEGLRGLEVTNGHSNLDRDYRYLRKWRRKDDTHQTSPTK